MNGVLWNINGHKKLRVVYFTIVQLDKEENGGHLCCRNHLERLTADPDLECIAVVAGPADREPGTREFFRTRGITGHFIAFTENSTQGERSSTAATWFANRWPFFHEIEGREQSHVDGALNKYILENAPECVIIDYIPSVFYAPTTFFSKNTPVITITLNREADFYADMMRHIHGGPANRIACLRLRLLETLIYWHSRSVFTIGKFDAPRPILGRPATYWMPPYMDPKPDPWSYSGSRSVFFVGNRHHYPNRDAIEWLATQLAPELQILSDPPVRITIVGASRGEVPEAWHMPNVDYLGFANASTLKGLFQSQAALIAPIANNFGAKFKVAEAIAYGTPLLVPQKRPIRGPVLDSPLASIS